MVPIETVGDGSQLVQVEVGVASDERVERPADLGDALLECLRPLGELERVPDARVPPIRQLFRDLARGRGFPTCAMSGAGNSSSHAWASAPAFCPPQYTRTWDGPNGPVHSCDYAGAIAITVNGAPFSQTWWSMAGDAVTEFSPDAKTQLGTWDTRFDDDYAAWLAARPPVDPSVAAR